MLRQKINSSEQLKLATILDLIIAGALNTGISRSKNISPIAHFFNTDFD
ncbi:MAG: hypothetical protein ACJAZP_002431 [Psychromonas sp.]|jgi:hypothetical protein